MPMSYRLLRLALIAVPGILLASTAAAQPGRITGLVVDSKTGNRLVGTLVALEGNRLTALTNGQGVYRLENVGAGQHQVTVSRLGYATQTLAVQVTAEQIAQLDFKMDERAV